MRVRANYPHPMSLLSWIPPSLMEQPPLQDPTPQRGAGWMTPPDSTPQDVATLQFCANKLDKKDFFGKSDPFMVFYRSNEDGT